MRVRAHALGLGYRLGDANAEQKFEASAALGVHFSFFRVYLFLCLFIYLFIYLFSYLVIY
jgi:hypothetical protein